MLPRPTSPLTPYRWIALGLAVCMLVTSLFGLQQTSTTAAFLPKMSVSAAPSPWPHRWIALGLAVCMLVASLLEALTVNVYFNILFR